MIALDSNNIQRLVEVLTSLGYVSRLPVDPNDLANETLRNEWIQMKNLKAFNFYHPEDPLKMIDIVLDQPLNFQQIREHEVIKKVGNIEIHMAGLDDLIRLKKHSGRSRDLYDIQMLEKAKQLENRESRRDER